MVFFLLFCYNKREVTPMDNMQKLIKRKKIYLKRYRKNKACILRLKNKLYILDSKLKNPKSPSYSSMPRGNLISTEDILADKYDLEKRINKLTKKAENLKFKILNEIDTIDDPRYCEILEAYFIECMDMEDIADRMGYGKRHIYKLYAIAIQKLIELEQ